MKKGYNIVAFMRPNAKLDFSFSEQDWRLRHDYDVTIGELLGEHFFKASKNFMEPKGLLHRTQGYGLSMDMMALAGLASIPETESMLGTEMNLKVMSSGALLYNRPIVSAESVVFASRAYMTTPQKIKMAVDKLFAAGVNQVIYHGVPYHYVTEKTGPEGWYPFSSPMLGSINFASNLSEANIFWKDQKAINEYINRVQYALRSGKSSADVLIYYPFINLEGMPDNSEEILTRGYIEGVEPPLPEPKGYERPGVEKIEWAKIVYPLINQLESKGITWAWVNDASIQEAEILKDGKINIRGNVFNALILANDSILPLKTAEKIKLLAARGMSLLATGNLPSKQPSYLNWKVNDKLTENSIAAALKGKNSKYFQEASDLDKWMDALPCTIRFNGNYSFVRSVQREMSDGSHIQFIWNKSNQWKAITLSLDKKYKDSYWLNTEDGTTIQNNNTSVTYELPPYGSVILFASTKSIQSNNTAKAYPITIAGTKEIIVLNNWNIKADSIEIKNSPLFDWKTNGKLKFSSAEGIYTTSFDWNNVNAYAHYYLDLGNVYFTAEVYINGKAAGKRIFAPYLLDITKFLLQGTNTIEVHITPNQLNSLVGKAKEGDIRYKQFSEKEDQLMSAGLIGPVVIRSVNYQKQ
jgi:hypothetical protein